MPIGPTCSSDSPPWSWPHRAGAIVVLAALAVFGPSATAAAKTPGATYCYLGHCHRVLTLEETRRSAGRSVAIRTSFYDDCARDRYNPCRLTSSGEVFRPDAPDNAASPIYPDGTLLLAYYPVTGAAAVLRVNNTGPYHGRRLLDVSRATAEALGFAARGIADLDVMVLEAPRREDSLYRRHRRYRPVHGPIGRHASLAEAHVALTRVAGPFAAIAAAPAAAVIDAEVASAEVVGAGAAPVPDASSADPDRDAVPQSATWPSLTILASIPPGPDATVAHPQPFVPTDLSLVVAASADRSDVAVVQVHAVEDGLRTPTAPTASEPRSAGLDLLLRLPPAAERRPRPAETETEADADPGPADSGASGPHPLQRFAPAIARAPSTTPPADDREPASHVSGPIPREPRRETAHAPIETAPSIITDVLSALRRSARRGVTPAPLPDLSIGQGVAAVGSAWQVVTHLAGRARIAARAEPGPRFARGERRTVTDLSPEGRGAPRSHAHDVEMPAHSRSTPTTTDQPASGFSRR